MAACVSIRDCRRRTGKGGKERASVEGAVNLPMSIQYKKKNICVKPMVLASCRKRIDVCVCVCVCGKKARFMGRMKETAKGVASRAQPNFRGPKNWLT
jgi:hypothetical protein